MVRGPAALDRAVKASEALFGGSINGLSSENLLQIFKDVPNIRLSSDDMMSKPLIDLIAKSGLVKSKKEIRCNHSHCLVLSYLINTALYLSLLLSLL